MTLKSLALGVTAGLIAASLTACGSSSPAATSSTVASPAGTVAASPAASFVSGGSSAPSAGAALADCASVKGEYPSLVGKKLTMATDPEIPSYSFIDQTKSSTVQGFNIDWMTAVAACLGSTYSTLPTSFPGLIPALEAGRADLVDSNLVATPARLAQVDFVTFQRQIEVFLRPKGNPKTISTIADLCGHSIAVVPSSLEQALAVSQNTACKAASKSKVTISPYNDLAGGTQAVLTGRSDVFMEPDSFAFQAVGSNPAKLEAGPRLPQGDTYIGFALPKSSTTLSKALLAATLALQANGTEAALFKKWAQSAAYVAPAQYVTK